VNIAFWTFIVAIIAGCLIPFVLYWMKNREQIVIDLVVKTEHHPNCMGEFHENGVSRLEGERHDHILIATLSIANKGTRPIRIRDIEATGITDKRTKILIQHEDCDPEKKEITTGERPSTLEELRDRLPQEPIKNEDPAWAHKWKFPYTSCEKRPPLFKVTVKTDRKTHHQTIRTDNCSHDAKSKTH